MRIRNSLYTANQIASYIIKKCLESKKEISNLQLQKILYYTQAAFLVKVNRPAFSDDIVAWKYGPVVKDIYQEYKCNSNRPIYDYIPYDGLIADDHTDLIDEIILAKSDYSAFELVEQTHEELPWIDTNINETISIIKIKEYFSDVENKKRIWMRKNEVA
ncbi:Panacea domain-containing protein [Peptostreptococcus sp.]|uniref:Panacea domain-containing protein n=1 Tax=Peptostreptococcus sp. TaxID=1262 RepID=UPI001CB20EEC|nr:type II toxin-antitoxin system antitoxin SocA domain-containing protein [Peptostreptococcus sp.]MBF1049432.1 DUF4065 domain-containing protein [Peptostreptococcus sp.]